MIKNRIFNPASEADIVFLRDFAAPYFSNVFHSLMSKGNTGFLPVATVKSYMNLPEMLGKRVSDIMNANGDERIDHDEFI